MSSLFKSKDILEPPAELVPLLQEVRHDGFWVAPEVTCFKAAPAAGDVGGADVLVIVIVVVDNDDDDGDNEDKDKGL